MLILKVKTHKKDIIYTGFIAGTLATIGNSLVYAIASFALGVSTSTEVIARLIFPDQKLTLVKFFFSYGVHFVAGSLLGILLVLIFRRFGSDHPFLKGFTLGFVFWIVHILIIPNLVAPTIDVYRTEIEVAVDLVTHLIYGLIATIFLIKEEF